MQMIQLVLVYTVNINKMYTSELNFKIYFQLHCVSSKAATSVNCLFVHFQNIWRPEDCKSIKYK